MMDSTVNRRVFPLGSALPGLIVLITVSGFAAWAFTYSTALDRARTLEPRAHTPQALAHVARLALDHLDRQPWSQEAARLAAASLSRLDHPEQAEEYYRRAGTLDQSQLHTRAYAWVRANQRDQAIAAYRHLVERYPDDAEAQRLLAGLYYSRKQYQEAILAARRLSELPAGAIEGHRLLGTILHETGNPESAVDALERVVELDPSLARVPADGHAILWTYLAMDLISIGRADDAIRYLERALRSQDDPLMRVMLGRAYQQRGELDIAEEQWRRALQRDPALALGWLELGRLQLAQSRLDEAQESLSRAVQLAPEDYEVVFALRSVAQRQGDDDRARAFTQRLETLRARRESPMNGMGPRTLNVQ